MGLQQYQKQSCEIRSPTARTKRLQILHYIQNNILTAFLFRLSSYRGETHPESARFYSLVSVLKEYVGHEGTPSEY